MAIVAAVCVLVLLITPAPDELPRTAPHSLDKTISPLIVSPFVIPLYELLGTPVLLAFARAAIRGNLLALTCTRLC